MIYFTNFQHNLEAGIFDKVKVDIAIAMSKDLKGEIYIKYKLGISLN